MERDIEGLLAGYGFAVPPVLLPQSNLLIVRAGPSAYELLSPVFSRFTVTVFQILRMEFSRWSLITALFM
jgi:hypothetical protein